MTRTICMLFAAAWLVLSLVAPATAQAQTREIKAQPVSEGGGGDKTAAVAPKPGAIKAIVRGFYVEARVGGGYMIVGKDAKLPEKLGPGALVHLATGYDLSDMIAIQLVGGATMVSTARTKNMVRDLSLLFGGAGLRLAIDLGARSDLLLSGGVAYVGAANGVEKAQAGVAAFGGIGFEYYVHVRHFSVGLELSVFAPIQPFRMFLGLAPMVKYTF